MVVGQDQTIDQLLICALTGSHALLVGVPGPAKTLPAGRRPGDAAGKGKFIARLDAPPAGGRAWTGKVIEMGDSLADDSRQQTDSGAHWRRSLSVVQEVNARQSRRRTTFPPVLALV